MTTAPSPLGQRLRFVRTELIYPKLSSRQMAFDVVGVARRIYQGYELYGRMPRADKIIRVVDYVNENFPARFINADWLLKGVGAPADGQMLVLLQSGVVMDISPTLEQRLGIQAAAIAGKSADSFLAFDSRTEIERTVPDNGEDSYSATLIRDDGSRFETTVFPTNTTFANKPARLLRFEFKNGSTHEPEMPTVQNG